MHIYIFLLNADLAGQTLSHLPLISINPCSSLSLLDFELLPSANLILLGHVISVLVPLMNALYWVSIQSFILITFLLRVIHGLSNSLVFHDCHYVWQTIEVCQIIVDSSSISGRNVWRNIFRSKIANFFSSDFVVCFVGIRCIQSVLLVLITFSISIVSKIFSV